VKGVSPAFFLELNHVVPDGRLLHILECNPNRFSRGNRTLDEILEKIFQGKLFLDVSRVDLNADVLNISVDFFRRTLRIPRKRKTTEFAVQNLATTSYSSKGVTGFYIGCSPSLLRVYDKGLEMKLLGGNVTGLPKIYTRLEWELRQRKCPIRTALDLPLLKDIRPFENVEILDVGDNYDFHYEPNTSLWRYMFNRLAEDYGAHEAARILNTNRNFKRDIGPLTLNTDKVRELLQDSYVRSMRLFFENQFSDTEVINESLDP
jgi:hypothetical protein